ncbi:fused PTS fructose transporter subunit IIA/HPr protein, partial [Vibrio diabolicus]
MLKLNKNDITLSQSATDKFEAIKSIAHSLTDKGLVEHGY